MQIDNQFVSTDGQFITSIFYHWRSFRDTDDARFAYALKESHALSGWQAKKEIPALALEKFDVLSI